MEDFVPYELAVKLKEKGFDWDTREIYERNILACIYEDYPKPTISQVLKWLRKEKKIVISILPSSFNNTTSLSNYYYVVYDIKEYFWDKYEYSQSFETYEECELRAIEYTLDNLI